MNRVGVICINRMLWIVLILSIAGCSSSNTPINEENVTVEEDRKDIVVKEEPKEGSNPKLRQEKMKNNTAKQETKHNKKEDNGISDKPKEEVTSSQKEEQRTQQNTEAKDSKVSQEPKTETKESSPTKSDSDKPDENEEEQKITEEQIKSKYKSQLLGLQQYYSGQLENLYKSAISDLKNNTEDKKAVQSKYISKGMSLKEESEAKVNQTLFHMQKELKENGFTLESVDELRSTYHNEISKAMKNAFNHIRGN